jgi:predicted XRE-type DNA-binding protein
MAKLDSEKGGTERVGDGQQEPGVRGYRFEPGSGNVFADLGLPDADHAPALAGLAHAVAETIERRGLTQEEAAAIMGLDQPKVSAMVRGRLAGFSQDRLTRCVLALSNVVEITIRPGSHDAQAGHLAVTLG